MHVAPNPRNKRNIVILKTIGSIVQSKQNPIIGIQEYFNELGFDDSEMFGKWESRFFKKEPTYFFYTFSINRFTRRVLEAQYVYFMHQTGIVSLS